MTAVSDVPAADHLLQIPRRHGAEKPKPQPLQQPTTEGEASGQDPDGASNKSLVPSALKPAPSHTILKTPRRPSALGTRPKARFVSPPDGKTKDGDTSPRSNAPNPSETSRYTVLPSALAEARLPIQSLAEPLPRGATLGQQKDMAEALGITTQVKLVKQMQGMRSPEKNLIQKMHPVNSPLLSVPPTGAAPPRETKPPRGPALAPQPSAEAPPLRTDTQEHLRQQRAPPGAAQGQAGKAVPQAPITGPHEKPRLVKMPQGAEYPQQAGVPEGWIEIGPKKTLPKPKEVRPRPRNGSGTQPKMSESSGQRQRGANKGTVQASGPQEPEESGYIVPEMTERSQLVTRRRVVPLPVSRRPRFVMPPRKPTRQNSTLSDTSTTGTEPWSGRMTPTKPAVRPPGVAPLENITAPSLGDVAGLPVRTKRVSLQTQGPQLWAPPTEPVSQSAGGAGQSSGFKPWVPPPNPLPKEVDHVSSLSEFFVYPSPAPPPVLGRTNLLPPPSAGPIRPGVPAVRPSPALRSRSDIRPGTPSSLFPPSLLLVRASTETAEMSDMTARGEFGPENASPAPPRYSPRSNHPALQRPTSPARHTARSTAPPIPFGRTRSQLKVLLETRTENAKPSMDPTFRGRRPSRE
jgi:hypothetical protein